MDEYTWSRYIFNMGYVRDMYSLVVPSSIHAQKREGKEAMDSHDDERHKSVVRSVVRDDDVDADERERRRDDDGDEHRCCCRRRRRVDARENAVVGTSRDRGRCRF